MVAHYFRLRKRRELALISASRLLRPPGPLRSLRPLRLPPVPHCGHFRQNGERRLGRLAPTEVESNGAIKTLDLGVRQPCFTQALAPRRLCPSRSDRSDVRCRRSESNLKRRLIELGIVGQDADVARRVEA